MNGCAEGEEFGTGVMDWLSCASAALDAALSAKKVIK
jgi:hypothetical protein